jgi:nucleoside-diphosphate-sugar epimerase
MGAIAVIGAGWLGLPLAMQLKQQRHTVYATRTSSDRLSELDDLSLPCFELSLGNHPHTPGVQAADPIAQRLIEREIKTVVGTFPPGFRKGGGECYALHWQTLIDACLKAEVEKVVMVSSSTVYPDRPQLMLESDASIDNANDNPDFSHKAQVMLRAEQAVIDSGLNFVILRCSGLFGPNRHPARFVSKLSSVSQKAPVNMVHLDDALSAVRYAISALSNEIVNVTCPETVSKAAFYQEALIQSAQPVSMPPITDTPAKRISAQKLVNSGFCFKYVNVLDGLKHT